MPQEWWTTPAPAPPPAPTAPGGWWESSAAPNPFAPPPAPPEPAPTPGFFNRTPRQWLADAVRIGGGWLAGIPAVEPGLGTAAGAAIGAGSEGLAQLIGGEDFNPAAVGVASAAGAVPLGRLFKGAGSLAADAGLLDRIALLGKAAVPNALKGAALNTGVDMAYRGARGEAPGRDYSLREELLPAAIGAAGGAATSLAARKVLPFERPAPADVIPEPTPPPSPVPAREPWQPTPGMAGEPLSHIEQVYGIHPERITPGGKWWTQEPVREQAPLPLHGTTEQPDLFSAPSPTSTPIEPVVPTTPVPAAPPAAPVPPSAAQTPENTIAQFLRGDAERLGRARAGVSEFPTAEPGVSGVGTLPSEGAPTFDLNDEFSPYGAFDLGDLGSPVTEPHTPTVPEPHTPPAAPEPPVAAAPPMPEPTSPAPSSAEDTIRRFFRFDERPTVDLPEARLRANRTNLGEPLETPITSEFRGAPPDPETEWLTRASRAQDLPAGERRAAILNDERFQHLLGDESGQLSPELLYYLGAGAGGAVAGPAVNAAMGSPEDPRLAAFGGAGLGLLGTVAARNPALLERLRFSNLFSGAAIPKSALGNVGGAAAYALENPEARARVLQEFLSPETWASMKQAFREGSLREAEPTSTGSPLERALDLPGRLIGAPDEATRGALARAGATAEEAGQYTMSGQPSSGPGRWITSGVSRFPLVRQLIPVARTTTNLIERGIERTPGLGGLEAVKNWSGASDELARRRQLYGLASFLTGAGAGYETAPGQDFEDLGSASPYATALMGPYALPAALGGVAGRAYAQGKPLSTAMLSELQNELPLPSVYNNPMTSPGRYLGQFVPFGGATRLLYPVPQSDFDTRGLFAPSASLVPLLNEAVVPRRR